MSGDSLMRISWTFIWYFLVGASLAVLVALALLLALAPEYAKAVFWMIGDGLNWSSPAITAIATAAVAYFTWTIWRINSSQLEHGRAVERSYLWPGFGRHEAVEGGMKWYITVTNTGRMAGVLQTIRYAVITEEAYEAGGYKFEMIFTDREDIIAPSTLNPGQETGLDFTIKAPMVCCGWIEYEDVFGSGRRQGWRHRLNLTPDSAGNYSNPFPGCYSSSYKPWET
jgi:hypothetical protein